MWKCQVIFIACEVTQGGAREREGIKGGGGGGGGQTFILHSWGRQREGREVGQQLTRQLGKVEENATLFL